MRLSRYTDYMVRVLMQAAVSGPKRITVDGVAGTFRISRHHLVKAVHDLGRHGFLSTRRGVGGGFTLARAPEEILLGDVIRLGEESEAVIDCRDRSGLECLLLPACRLKVVLDEAAAAFFAVLDRCTLADLVEEPTVARKILQIPADEACGETAGHKRKH